MRRALVLLLADHIFLPTEPTVCLLASGRRRKVPRHPRTLDVVPVPVHAHGIFMDCFTHTSTMKTLHYLEFEKYMREKHAFDSQHYCTVRKWKAMSLVAARKTSFP